MGSLRKQIKKAIIWEKKYYFMSEWVIKMKITRYNQIWCNVQFTKIWGFFTNNLNGLDPPMV